MLYWSKTSSAPSPEPASARRTRARRYAWSRRKSTRSSKSTCMWPGAWSGRSQRWRGSASGGVVAGDAFVAVFRPIVSASCLPLRPLDRMGGLGGGILARVVQRAQAALEAAPDTLTRALALEGRGRRRGASGGCGARLQSRGDALVPRRAHPRVAVLAGRELVRRDAGLDAARALRMVDAEPVGQREMPRAHRAIHLDGDDDAGPLGGETGVAAVGEAEPRGVAGRDAEGSVGVGLPPPGIAHDGVRGERAPLACGQEERPIRIVARRSLAAEAGQLLEQLGDVEVNAPVWCLDAAPRLVVLVVGEHDARRAAQDRVEEVLARLETLAEPGAAHARRAHRGAAVRRRPERGGGGGAPRQRRAKRPVEDRRRDGAEPRVWPGGQGESRGELAPPA